MESNSKAIEGRASAPCSPSSLSPETDEAWKAVSRTPDGMYDSRVPISAFAYAMSRHSKKMERERDEARSLHAYANEQRKAADNDRMNAEETVARLRARVDNLLKHGQDSCEYTDGWEDALLKVRDEFPPENADVEPPRKRKAND